MFAIIYIIFSIYLGTYISQFILKQFRNKLPIDIQKWFLITTAIPLGLMATTSWIYIFYYLFKNSSHALLYANFSLIIPFLALLKYHPLKWESDPCWYSSKISHEVIFFFFISIIGSFLFFHTISSSMDFINIGMTVHSDFGPHTSMMRSFSVGLNVPTNYPLFSNAGVRYHFLFYFLCGNLEFLGLSLPLALNIASLLTFVSAFLLFFVLIKFITDNYVIAWLTLILFLFRSSPAFPFKIYSALKGEVAWRAIFSPDQFIALTENEHWGLWGINIWANQRHLSTGFSILLIIIFFIWVIYFPKKKEATNS